MPCFFKINPNVNNCFFYFQNPICIWPITSHNSFFCEISQNKATDVTGACITVLSVTLNVPVYPYIQRVKQIHLVHFSLHTDSARFSCVCYFSYYMFNVLREKGKLSKSTLWVTCRYATLAMEQMYNQQ
jgi:hypothetical protein